MKIIRILRHVLLILSASLLLWGCQDESKTNTTKPTQSSATTEQTTPTKPLELVGPPPNTKTSCLANKTWFDGSFDPLIAAQKFSGGSLCAFHQFAWQTFIWLTNETSTGKIRFDTLFSDGGISPDSQPGNHVLGGVNQAGSNGILIDQNGRAVYTTMMINDVYRNFVIANKLYTKQGMQAVDANLNFPDGAMSLKASWKIIEEGEDTNGLFTATMPLHLLHVVNDTVTVDSDAKLQEATVALVGFHIAVYVNKHPEAIWATFEQAKNAPEFSPNQSPNAPVSGDNFTFYAANTKASECNANNSGSNAILQLDATSQKMNNISQACLVFPFGTNHSTPSAQSNRDAISQLNASVHQMMPATTIWKNYNEVGAVWFSKSNALKPDWNPNTDDSLLIGSTRLSNTTIETFTQNVSSQHECFSCHNTMTLAAVPDGTSILSGKNVNTSHILLQNYIDGNVVKR